MIIVRQSTARIVTVGPVLDADGVAVTGSVVGDFKISKNGGAPAALNGSATLTHRHTGYYSLSLTTSDLDTVGSAEITCDDTVNACPVKEMVVIEEAIYDALFAASANAFSGSAGASTLTALASGSITAAVIATGAIDADAIADNAIDAGAIASDAITAAKIANGAIDAATFAADVDAEILSYIVDDATRIDASALNTATGTSIPDILTDTGTTLQAELDGIQADTEDIQSRLPAALTGDGNIKADALKFEGADPTDTIDARLAAYDPPTRAELTSDKNEILAGVGRIAAGTIGSTGNSTTALHLSGLTFGDDELNNLLIVIYDVSNSEYHARWIEDWADTGDLATVATLPFTPQNATDTYVILPIRQDVSGGSGLDAAGVRAAIGMASANLDTQLSTIDTVVDTILVDTNELQTDWTNGGRLDLIVDATLADTNELQTDWVNGGRLDLLIDGIKAKTDSLTFTVAGVVDANALRISGSATAADNVEVVYDADFSANYNTTADCWLVQLDDGVTHGGTSALLRLGSSGSTPALYVTNSGGTAAYFQASSGNNYGFRIDGAGSNAALYAAGGSGGQGALFVGTNNHGFQCHVASGSNASGISASTSASGTSYGIDTATMRVVTSSIAWNAAWDAEVQSEVEDGLNNLGFTTTVSGRIDAAVSTRSTHAAADVWAVGTRTLTTLDEDSTTLDLDATIRAAVGLASANLDTQLGDLPTVAEFEARTLVAADYFDPAADTVANVTTVGSVTTKTGYALASNGLDSISTTAPSGVASNFREMLVAVWRRFFKRTTKDSDEIKTYADNGTSVLTTQTYTVSGSDEDVGAAT